MKFTLIYTLASMLPISQALWPYLAGNAGRMIRGIARSADDDGSGLPSMRTGLRERREALDAPAANSAEFITVECDANCKDSFRSYVDQNNHLFLTNDSFSYMGAKTTHEIDWPKVVPHLFYTGNPPSLTRNPMLAIEHCLEIQVKEDPEEVDLRFTTSDNAYKVEGKFQAVEFTCVDEDGIKFGVTSPVMLSLEIKKSRGKRKVPTNDTYALIPLLWNFFWQLFSSFADFLGLFF